MENQMKELVAIGASVTANCLPCLEYHVDKARQCGVSEQDIEEAVIMGKMVRKGASNKMDRLASNLLQNPNIDHSKSQDRCGCS